MVKLLKSIWKAFIRGVIPPIVVNLFIFTPTFITGDIKHTIYACIGLLVVLFVLMVVIIYKEERLD